MDLMRLFNDPVGLAYLESNGIPAELTGQLHLLGISSISNLVSAIKTAKYYEMDGKDVIFTSLTDSMEMYESRMVEHRQEFGDYTEARAAADFARWLLGAEPEHVKDLGYKDRKQIHNFKYFTWVEQQAKDVEDLRRLWDRDFWPPMFAEADLWDERIREFNDMVGLL